MKVWLWVALVLLVFVAGCGGGDQDSQVDFDLEGPGGERIRLSDYRGQVVLLNFWASWCPPCREEMPALDMLQAACAEQGLVVLAINLAESRTEADAFMRAGGYDLTVALDSNKDVAKDLGVRNLPTSIMVDRDGYVVERFVGVLNLQQAKALVLPWLEQD